MSITYQRVPNPTVEQVEATVALFTDLMKEDIAALCLSGAPALIPDLARAMIKAGIYAAGEYYLATDENGEIVGYTMWMPPGQEMFSTPEQRALGLNDFMVKLPEEGREYPKSFGKVDSWWLHMAMVRRDYQHQGIAKTLINMVRDKAIADGAIIALSTTTDENVPIYQKCGFELKGTMIMPSPLGEWPLHVLALPPK
ncbi:hypothetical protein M378DRAFT_182786 [Amanita muscaria Koide BX008]|uniref:N-acetyltransferase domain-containing protein n=1 Tax=Amanita muscaria (strain Koide BX008) TaxID=946122 RepID=A0A0C2XPS6_AMAMK|nr:hypothetical protein M378DRAFT_182786 [Amanita muscaria Koide BX008]